MERPLQFQRPRGLRVLSRNQMTLPWSARRRGTWVETLEELPVPKGVYGKNEELLLRHVHQVLFLIFAKKHLVTGVFFQ